MSGDVCGVRGLELADDTRLESRMERFGVTNLQETLRTMFPFVDNAQILAIEKMNARTVSPIVMEKIVLL